MSQPALLESAAKPRVLCCIWGELRGIRASAESLKECVLQPLEADVLVYAQRQLPDDDDRLRFLREALQPHLRSAAVYEKIDPRDFFHAESYDAMKCIRGNWLNPGNSQVLINHVMLGDLLQESGLLQEYDLFIFTRSDYLHLVPFPSAEQLLACLEPNFVLTQAGHEFGGVNYNLSVMRQGIVADYLQCARTAITGQIFAGEKKTLNIERFFDRVFRERKWLNVRMDVTCFITSEALDDRTTWKKIKAAGDEYGNALFKYEAQMIEAHKSLEVWREQPEWRVLQPIRKLFVAEAHGRALRPFAVALEGVVQRAPTAHFARRKLEKEQAAAAKEGYRVDPCEGSRHPLADEPAA
eukprot:TRINITY_DN17882_c0_g1_i1.p1 TRINITY_DN17882_c0_g1~~TRINITY_DN17882_c0_g1_i1.p1  ORF type:complete len:354 (+),score=65.50 TRINITY_DN17882_c0_g1_i1:254-1315(+)